TLWADRLAQEGAPRILATLIEVYEEEHHPIDPPDPVAAILFRMDEMGLTRKDLERILGSRMRVSEVLRKKSLDLLCGEGSGAFNVLPAAIRHLGPWTGGAEGDINRLRLAYRVMLTEQGFVVVYEHVSKLQIENVAGVHPANTECPECKGKARVPMHG